MSRPAWWSRAGRALSLRPAVAIGPPAGDTSTPGAAVGGPWSSPLATGITLLLGTVIALTARWGPDWPAQQFRATLARDAGLVAWSDQWYAGLALPGYSLLYPPFAKVLGAAITGVAAATVAAWLAGRLLPATNRWAHRRYSIAVAFTLAGNLLIGQIPFLLGTAFGLGALLALVRGRTTLAATLAVGASLSSPLAGAFLLMVAVAYASVYGWRRAVPLASAVAGMAVASVAGGADGPFPCPWSSLAGVLGFCALAWLFSSRQDALLRRFVLLYTLAGIACFLVPNPIGGNITRLGKLIALPLACYLLTYQRRRELTLRIVACVIPALIWPLAPLSSAIAHGATDPSQSQAYYSGLLSFLKTQNPDSGRLEIPFTREHWESAWVAPVFPLARGWERQTDLRYNSVLYKPLTANTYKQWLDNLAVSMVALPNVPIDYGGKAEAQLLQHPPSYLIPVWHDRNWQVWKVADAEPLASGATITNLTSASFQANFSHPGTATVRIRSSNLWQVTKGVGCVQPTPDGWLQVSSPIAGPVTVSARLDLHLLTGSSGCSPPKGR